MIISRFFLLILSVSHTVRRRTVRKSEVREMPSLPRGGGDELVRDEQVSSRRVRLRSLPVGETPPLRRAGPLLLLLLQVETQVSFFSQKQLEDYLNKLLRMAMYRKYHHTVSNHTVQHNKSFYKTQLLKTIFLVYICTKRL